MGDTEQKQLKSGSGPWYKHKSAFVSQAQALKAAHPTMRLVLICQSPYSHDIAFRVTNNVGGTSQEWEDAFVKLCGDLDNREVVPRLHRELAGVSQEALGVFQKALQLGLAEGVWAEKQVDWFMNIVKGRSHDTPVGECPAVAFTPAQRCRSKHAAAAEQLQLLPLPVPLYPCIQACRLRPLAALLTNCRPCACVLAL